MAAADRHAADATGSRAPRVGLSLMTEPGFERAVAPLFADGLVDVVEWSFDTCWVEAARPAWLADILDGFAARDALLGHGVTFDPLGGSGPIHAAWLARCADECARRRYARVSEHCGVMRAGAWIDGAAFPPPPTATTIAVGRERLARLRDACGTPIGLENLAFAFGRLDVEREGDLLEALLAPIDGFLLLDLHNLWCRSLNFALDFDSLLERYPLDRVRELHLSGGSWSEVGGRRIRRDTHDGPTPTAVFDLLPRVLARCPAVDAVILERLGGTLATEESGVELRADFARLRSICQGTAAHHHGS